MKREAALAEVLGPEAALSRSTVSRICAELKEQFERFCSSDLSGLRLDYLFLDGANFKMHEHARPEPVLVAWGIDTDGRPHLVAIEAASSESTDAWGNFLGSLKARGLRPPLLVISDGAPGLIAGIEVQLPQSLRQRCVIHRLRNTAAKVSAGDLDAFKADWWGVFDNIEEPPGDAAVKECLQRLDGFRVNWEKAYPSAVACLVDDFASLSVHLRFPTEHWRRIRHTQPDRADIRRDPPAHQGDRTAVWRTQLRHAHLAGARPTEPRMAWGHHDPQSRAAPPRPPPSSLRRHHDHFTPRTPLTCPFVVGLPRFELGTS